MRGVPRERRERLGLPPMVYGAAGYVICRDTEAEAQENGHRIREAQVSPQTAIAFLEQVWGRDLSAYNILYWDGKITLIDFPQVVETSTNYSAAFILEREVAVAAGSAREAADLAAHGDHAIAGCQGVADRLHERLHAPHAARRTRRWCSGPALVVEPTHARGSRATGAHWPLARATGGVRWRRFDYLGERRRLRINRRCPASHCLGRQVCGRRLEQRANHGRPCRLERIGVRTQVMAAAGTSEDIAMLLADGAGASLLIAVGTHATLDEFLDRQRRNPFVKGFRRLLNPLPEEIARMVLGRRSSGR